MSQATLAKAGDLFFTGRPGGTGVGLALVRRLAEEHSGTLALESELGKGTTVTLNIPRFSPPNESSTAAQAVADRSSRRGLPAKRPLR